MSDIVFLKNELSELIGKPVSFLRLAVDVMILYFDGEPGDASFTTLWINPSWRYEKNGKMIVGSRDITYLDKSDFETTEAYESAFESLCDLTNPLNGSCLQKFEIVPGVNDLYLAFSSEQVVRSFTARNDHECWCYRNRKKKICIQVSTTTIDIVQMND